MSRLGTSDVNKKSFNGKTFAKVAAAKVAVAKQQPLGSACMLRAWLLPGRRLWADVIGL